MYLLELELADGYALRRHACRHDSRQSVDTSIITILDIAIIVATTKQRETFLTVKNGFNIIIINSWDDNKTAKPRIFVTTVTLLKESVITIISCAIQVEWN